MLCKWYTAKYWPFPKIRRNIRGYYRLIINDTTKYDHNGTKLIKCVTLCNAVSSITEVETHDVFHSAKQILSISHNL